MHDIYIEKAAERNLKKLPATDRQIDQLVDELYNLTEEEIRLACERRNCYQGGDSL